MCNLKVVTAKLTRGFFTIEAPAARYNYDHTDQVEYVDEGRRLRIYGIRIDVRLSSLGLTARFRKSYMETVITELIKERQSQGHPEIKRDELLKMFTYSELLEQLQKLRTLEPDGEDNEPAFEKE